MRTLTGATLGWVAAVTLAAAPLAAVAQATYQFNLPEQALADTLRFISQQTTMNILFDPDSVLNLRAPALQATLTADQAIQQVLQGTRLMMRQTTSNTILVHPIPPPGAASRWQQISVGSEAASGAQGERVELEEVLVEGTTIDDQILSSRTGDTLRQRPQSVTIVDRVRLDEQNLTSVAAALAQTTGITTVMVNPATTKFYSRGFEIGSFQLDGGAPVVFNNFRYTQLPDLAIFEQVEVTRGPDALFSGNGEPSGTIQLVRKRPTQDRQLTLAATVGRWDDYRGEFDAGGPIGFDGKLGGRVVAVIEDRAAFYDNGDSNHNLLFGTLQATPRQGTQLTFGLLYDKIVQNQGGPGLPRYSDGGDLGLARSANLSAQWAKQDIESIDTFLRLEQDFGSSWRLRMNLTRNQQDSDYDEMFAYGHVDRLDGSGVAMVPYDTFTRVTQEGVDVTLRGVFELFGREHKVFLGADWQKIDAHISEGGTQWLPGVDVFTFDPRAVPRPAVSQYPQYRISWGQEQSGAFFSFNFALSSQLHLLGGARISRYEYGDDGEQFDMQDGTSLGQWLTAFEEDGVTTPYAGLTYDLNSGWTIYGSVSESYKSQASYRSGPFPGAPLDPIVGRNVEIGLKGGLLEGRAATQFAVYRIERDGEAILDPSHPTQGGPNGATCCYRAQGSVQSQGFDAEINGRLLERWSLFVGYTFNQNEYKAGYDSGIGAVYMPQTPKHLFRMWTTFELPGRAERWKLSAGVDAQSGYDVRGTAVTYDRETFDIISAIPYAIHQGGYSIIGARAEYQINDTWALSLNLDNLLDKRYYQTVGTTQWGNWYGTPRNFTLALRGKW